MSGLSNNIMNNNAIMKRSNDTLLQQNTTTQQLQQLEMPHFYTVRKKHPTQTFCALAN